MSDVIIAGAARTPMGGLQGVFADVSAADLGGVAIRSALEGAGLESPDELLMGNVLPAGQGQAPARQAGFAAGLGEAVPATTLNKMCGSGMKTVMMAHDAVALGQARAIVAGGMESMTQAPYLLPKMRGGARLGHGQVVDSMFLDGLEDAYDKGRLMGTSPRIAPRPSSSPARPRTIMPWPRLSGPWRPKGMAGSTPRSRP